MKFILKYWEGFTDDIVDTIFSGVVGMIVLFYIGVFLLCLLALIFQYTWQFILLIVGIVVGYPFGKWIFERI